MIGTLIALTVLVTILVIGYFVGPFLSILHLMIAGIWYVRAKKENKNKFDAFLNDIYSFNPHDVSVVESDETFVLSEDQINAETKSTMEIINSTIDNMTLNVSTQELKTLFSELYSESLSLEVE